MMMSCSVASASVAPVMAARAASAAASTRATIIARAANPTASRAHARLSSRAAHSHAGLALAVAAGPTHAQRISVLVEARGRGRRGGGGRRGRGRRPWRRDMNTGPRRNEDIDLAETRVMDEEKEFIGLMSSEEALALAEEAGLDLVLVSPDAKPPVCRIMNYSKFKYENEKKARETRKKAAASRVELKELKMRYNIDVHDYGVRLKAAQKFLGQGDRIKVTCQFRGRENEFRNIGQDMFMRFVDDVGADLGAIDGAPSMEGNRMVMLMSPVKEKKAIAQDGPSRRKKLTRKEKEAMAAEAAANPSSEDDDDEEYDDEEGSWDEDDEEGSWDEDDEADEDESVEEEEEEVMVFSKKN